MNHCQPCRERVGRLRGATRRVAGTWMCEECFSEPSEMPVELTNEVKRLRTLLESMQRDIRWIRQVMLQEHNQRLEPVQLAKADLVVMAVEDEFNVPVHLLASPSREWRFIGARMAICILLREHCDFSYPKIGKILGGRHHTSIIHLHRKAIASTSPKFLASLARLRKRLGFNSKEVLTNERSIPELYPILPAARNEANDLRSVGGD